MIPRLTEDQITQIHNASLHILDRTGVRFHVQEALDLFRRGGADVSDGNRVRIPADLVEWALDVAPKRIEIYDQTGESAMTLEGHRSYFGVGSDCMHIYDLVTGDTK